MLCPLCHTPLQGEGQSRICAYAGAFKANWNCGTLNLLRELIQKHVDETPIPGIDFQYCDDQRYATLRISEVIADPNDPESGRLGYALWVTWYKSRGKTEAVWLLDDNNPPRIPTADEINRICNYYKTQIT